MTAATRYWVVHDPLQGWQVVDMETGTHTCHCDHESAIKEAKRKEEEK